MVHIRDKEIDRCVKYANGLGIKVTWKKYDPRTKNEAEWSMDGTEITMYTWPRKPKVDIILDFVHELAHHMAWVHNGRKTSLKVDQAYGREDSKSARRIIYDAERSDSKFQDRIFKELGLKIPVWRLHATRRIDMWVYRRLWLTGRIPTEREIGKKKREIFDKCRKRYGP